MSAEDAVAEILALLDARGETGAAQYLRGMVSLVGAGEALAYIQRARSAATH